ncbi:MAG: hypothetical protein ACPHL6_04635 [Rubripirellula sp.]
MTGSPQDEMLELRKRLRCSHEMIVEGLPDHEGWPDDAVSLQAATKHRLRSIEKQYGAAWKAFIESVIELQPAARRKFALPNQPESHHLGANPHQRAAVDQGLRPRLWWVNQRAFEQSTCIQVARFKAGWFADQTIHDLCSGIGGDALSFVERGGVHCVERDPLVAAMASENLRSTVTTNSYCLHCCDLADYELPQKSWLHIDPDRRLGTRTSRDPMGFSPGWEEVCRRVESSEGAAVKLAPATDLPQAPGVSLDASNTHRMWIEFKGSVREQDLLWGGVCEVAGVKRGERSAVILQGDGSFANFQAPYDAGTTVESEHDLKRIEGGCLVDPRAAIRAAGLTAAFAKSNRLRYLSGPSGFLFASDLPSSVRTLAAVGTVAWIGSCDDRKLRKELRLRNCYPETIKVRGNGHDPTRLVKRYRNCGDQPVRLWIGRIGRRAFAAITEIA